MSTQSTRQVRCVSHERPALTMVEAANFLAKNHLDKYADAILQEGFDDTHALKLMNEEDGKVLVTKNGHRKRPGAALKMLQEQAHEETNQAAGEETQQGNVANFLSELRLDEYHDAIVEGGFADMDALVLIDEEDLKALVPKACHRKRLADEALKMVQQLAHEETHQADEESEQGTLGESDIANFLSELRLDEYHDAIVEDGYDDMAASMRLD